MVRILRLVGLSVFGWIISTAIGVADSDQRREAEAFFEQGAFAQAGSIYQSLYDRADTDRERFELALRVVDSDWRAAVSGQSDVSRLDTARKEFEMLVPRLDLLPRDEKERLRAELEESWGDSYWEYAIARDWGNAWLHYARALDYWAGSTQIDEARERYLALVKKASGLLFEGGSAGLAQDVMPWLPTAVIEASAQLAREEADVAWTHYLWARNLQQQGGVAYATAIEEAFKLALTYAAGSIVEDDLYFHYAEWLELERKVNTAAHQRDFTQSLSFYRKLLALPRATESSYYRLAEERIAAITETALQLKVSHIFLSGSPVEFQVTWKNAPVLDIAIYPAPMLDAVDFDRAPHLRAGQWAEGIDVSEMAPVHTNTFTTEPSALYSLQERRVRLEDGLARGTYIVTAEGGGKVARYFLLVTDATLVVKSNGKQLNGYVCESAEGRPLSNVPVVLWSRSNAQQVGAEWSKEEKMTDAEGRVVFQPELPEGAWEYWMAASTNQGEAFVVGSDFQHRTHQESWELVAFSDRLIYQKQDIVRWKASLRHDEGETLAEESEVSYQIRDTWGNVVAKGRENLSRWGSLQGELKLEDDFAAGRYELLLTVNSANLKKSATLFQVEDASRAKLNAQVRALSSTGEAKLWFRKGEAVQIVVASPAFVTAEESFVVELLVRRRPFLPLQGEAQEDIPFEGGEVQRIVSDRTGQMEYRLLVSEQEEGDFEYQVNARLFQGEESWPLKEARFFMTGEQAHLKLEPQEQLYRQGDTVTVRLQAVDFRGAPLAVRGRLAINRASSEELFLGPEGEKVSRSEFEALKARKGFFVKKIKPEDYVPSGMRTHTEDIVDQPLETTGSGVAEYTFTAAETGVYRIQWKNTDETGEAIEETQVWVAAQEVSIVEPTPALKIIPSQNEPRLGQHYSVLLVAPAMGQHVLLTLEGMGGLLEQRFIPLSGNAQWLDVQVTEEWRAGVVLRASMVREHQLYEVSLPLQIESSELKYRVGARFAQKHYAPGETGTLLINVSEDGRPVQTDLAISLVRGKVRPRLLKAYRQHLGAEIASATAGDTLRTVTSFQQRSYTRLSAVSQPRESAKVRSSSLAGPPQSRRWSLLNATPVHFAGEALAPIEWHAGVSTDAQGQASIDFTFPKEAGDWTALVWAVSPSGEAKIVKTLTRTSVDFALDLSAPSYARLQDEVHVLGRVTNASMEPLILQSDVSVQGGQFLGGADVLNLEPESIVPVLWRIQNSDSKDISIAASLSGDRYQTSAQVEIPILQDAGGEAAFLSGEFDSRSQFQLPLTLPQGDWDVFEFAVTPSLPVLILDALTTSFGRAGWCSESDAGKLASLLAWKHTLSRKGSNVEGALKHLFPVPSGLDLSKNAKADPFALWRDGVLERLAEGQNEEGAWAWCGSGDSDPAMTAYLVWSLTRCEIAGHTVDAALLEGARDYLVLQLSNESLDDEVLVWVLHALASRNEGILDKKPSRYEAKTFAYLWKQRTRLSPTGVALLALSAWYFDFNEEAGLLLKALLQAKRTPGAENGPVLSSQLYWESGELRKPLPELLKGRVQATAWALMALIYIQPDSEIIPEVVSWLAEARTGIDWGNTLDTSVAAVALLSYERLQAKAEFDVEFELLKGEQRIAQHRVTDERLFEGVSLFRFTHQDFSKTEAPFNLKRLAGSAPLYYAVKAKSHSLPENAVSGLVLLQRDFFRIQEVPTLLNGLKEETAPLLEGEPLQVSAPLEVALRIKCEKERANLVLEEPLPAGFELLSALEGLVFVELVREEQDSRSDAEAARLIPSGKTLSASVTLNQGALSCLLETLPRGIWEVRYRLRAEYSGRYQVPPARLLRTYRNSVESIGEAAVLQVLP